METFLVFSSIKKQYMVYVSELTGIKIWHTPCVRKPP